MRGQAFIRGQALLLRLVVVGILVVTGCGESGTTAPRLAAVGPTFIVLPSIYEHPLKIGDAALIAEASRIQAVESKSLIITSWSEATSFMRPRPNARIGLKA